ncbi:MAG: hypothetical protein ABJL67_08080 [Sulfitobacter sp.]
MSKDTMLPPIFYAIFAGLNMDAVQGQAPRACCICEYSFLFVLRFGNAAPSSLSATMAQHFMSMMGWQQFERNGIIGVLYYSSYMALLTTSSMSLKLKTPKHGAAHGNAV